MLEEIGFFILILFKTTGIQLLGVLGIFFLLGYILSKLQELTHRNYLRSVGWKGILLTAWIGTPIHELGHTFLCYVFGHRVIKVALFEPNEETGGLGYVNHSYRKDKVYQRIGNFFIGAAPMIFGSIILFTLLYFLLPNGQEVFAPLNQQTSNIQAFLISLKETLFKLFSLENLKTWEFWVFLYLAFCISSHIAPSKKDREGMWDGFGWLVFILLIVNIVTLGVGYDITYYILSLNHYLGILVAIFTFAIIISTIHYLLSTLILTPFRKIR